MSTMAGEGATTHKLSYTITADHDHIKPKSILNADIIELYAQDYLYLDSVKMVSAFKTGPFQEHSPVRTRDKGSCSCFLPSGVKGMGWDAPNDLVPSPQRLIA